MPETEPAKDLQNQVLMKRLVEEIKGLQMINFREVNRVLVQMIEQNQAQDPVTEISQVPEQVIVQKIREAERALVADAYESKVGELIYGEVKKQTKDGFIIDLGDNAEAYLAREETIHKEILRPKQRINAILYNVNREGRGAQLLLSRARPEMLIALMKKEIPEEIKDVLNFAAEKYSNSKATTNAGRILRLFARFITVDTVIKLFAYKVHK